MRKLILTFFFTMLFTLFLAGISNASAKKIPATLRTDSSKIEVKKFDANAIKRYKQDKDFNYNGEATGQPSFWERFWGWLWQKITNLFDGIPYSGIVLKYFLLALAIVFIAYII